MNDTTTGIQKGIFIDEQPMPRHKQVWLRRESIPNQDGLQIFVLTRDTKEHRATVVRVDRFGLHRLSLPAGVVFADVTHWRRG